MKEPDSDIENLKRRRQFWLWVMAASAVIAIAGPAFGLAGTIFGMAGAFDSLMHSGAADPAELSGDISTALTTTVAGLVAAGVGFVVFVCATARYWIIRQRVERLKAASAAPDRS